MDMSENRMGIGIIIKDDRGDVLARLSSSLPFLSHPIVKECQTLLRALNFFLELGMQQVEFEGDALAVIEAIKKESECLAWYGDLIEEAKQYFKGRSLWSLKFSFREGIRSSHVLAKFGLTLTDENVWIEEIPIFLSTTVLDDLSQ